MREGPDKGAPIPKLVFPQTSAAEQMTEKEEYEAVDREAVESHEPVVEHVIDAPVRAAHDRGGCRKKDGRFNAARTHPPRPAVNVSVVYRTGDEPQRTLVQRSQTVMRTEEVRKKRSTDVAQTLNGAECGSVAALIEEKEGGVKVDAEKGRKEPIFEERATEDKLNCATGKGNGGSNTRLKQAALVSASKEMTVGNPNIDGDELVAAGDLSSADQEANVRKAALAVERFLEERLLPKVLSSDSASMATLSRPRYWLDCPPAPNATWVGAGPSVTDAHDLANLLGYLDQVIT
jgi:hypothetical protein